MGKTRNKFRNFLLKSHKATGWVVWLSGAICATMMIMQKFVAAGSLPHSAAAAGLIAVSGGYIGTDRIACFIKSQSLQYGQADLGNPEKLRNVIILLFMLVIEALVLQVFFQTPGLPLDMLIAAFSGSAGAFAIGNKAIKAASSSSGTHAIEEKHVLISATEKSANNDQGNK